MQWATTLLYRICEWIMRFAYVNLLWILFSAIGLVILGFFPATIALFSVIRKWIMGYSDLPIFETFWLTYKQEWLKSNLYGAILTLISAVVYFDWIIFNQSSDPFLQWSKYPLFLLILCFGLTLLYAIPTYVHYDVNLFHVIKNAFFIMLINPIYNVVMILGLALIYLLISILPPLLFFFGGSSMAFVIMWSCYQSFMTIDRKKAKLKEMAKEP